MMLWDQHEMQSLPANSRAVLQQRRERKPHEVQNVEEAVGGEMRPISKMHTENSLMKQVVSLQNTLLEKERQMYPEQRQMHLTF